MWTVVATAVPLLLSLLTLGLPAAEPPEIAMIAEGVYARVVSPDGNAVANSGFVVLAHSVVVFDTHFTPEAGEELRGQVHRQLAAVQAAVTAAVAVVGTESLRTQSFGQ